MDYIHDRQCIILGRNSSIDRHAMTAREWCHERSDAVRIQESSVHGLRCGSKYYGRKPSRLGRLKYIEKNISLCLTGLIVDDILDATASNIGNEFTKQFQMSIKADCRVKDATHRTCDSKLIQPNPISLIDL